MSTTPGSTGPSDATTAATSGAPIPGGADNPHVARDAAYWAKPVEALHVDGTLPDGAINLNVEGRRLIGPFQGFGQLWQKSYRTSLVGTDVSPEEVVARWKERFASYWPEGFHFYGPLTGIAPGEVAVLNLAMPAKVTLSTGVMVVYADERSFTFMNAEGHQFGGFITFSADRPMADGSPTGPTIASVDVLLRANSPISEVALGVFGHRMEDRFWTHTLQNLAADHGVTTTPTVAITSACVDPRRQWRQWRNITKDAVFSSMLYSYRAIAVGLRERTSSWRRT